MLLDHEPGIRLLAASVGKTIERDAPFINLIVACMFAAAAISGALIEISASGNLRSPDSATLFLGRRAIDAFLNLFAKKMELCS
jgi:hypothetical protein